MKRSQIVRVFLLGALVGGCFDETSDSAKACTPRERENDRDCDAHHGGSSYIRTGGGGGSSDAAHAATPETTRGGVRLIDDAAAAALATIEYRNTKFDARRLYTAWDNLKDEKVFFRGVDRLADAGIPSKHLMAYMLIGYDPAETWDRIWHRFAAMVARGIEPYPMVYDRGRADLLCFQRWVITGLYRAVPWDLYRRETKSPESVAAYVRGHVEALTQRAA
jgi:hypothetical protein